ncbi:MAG: hypothetical protein U5O39_12095 [Gammaproteobacteria bacterium]|nr:hypothetical protein [Gammaproteobacteria bacterium]
MDNDLKYYAKSGAWTLEPATYDFQLGFSSRDLRLSQQWQLGEDFTPV